MTHLDPELLALLALGEDPATPEEHRHLAACDRCTAEVRRFARPISAVRSTGAPLSTPRPEVWAGIAAELGLARGDDPLTTKAAARRRRVGRRRVLVAAGAALALVATALAGGLALQPRQVAVADLRAFPDWPGATGTAVLQRLPDGSARVEVRATARSTPDEDREVWLMTAGARQLVSLGLLRGSSGTFAVPRSVDLRRFDLVDVSAEPRDGDPAHSGDSIVRGTLRS